MSSTSWEEGGEGAQGRATRGDGRPRPAPPRAQSAATRPRMASADPLHHAYLGLARALRLGRRLLRLGRHSRRSGARRAGRGGPNAPSAGRGGRAPGRGGVRWGGGRRQTHSRGATGRHERLAAALDAPGARLHPSVSTPCRTRGGGACAGAHRRRPAPPTPPSLPSSRSPSSCGRSSSAASASPCRWSSPPCAMRLRPGRGRRRRRCASWCSGPVGRAAAGDGLWSSQGREEAVAATLAASVCSPPSLLCAGHTL